MYVKLRSIRKQDVKGNGEQQTEEDYTGHQILLHFAENIYKQWIKSEVKQSIYTPWKRLGGEEV
jgi:hypothetical protein